MGNFGRSQADMNIGGNHNRNKKGMAQIVSEQFVK